MLSCSQKTVLQIDSQICRCIDSKIDSCDFQEVYQTKKLVLFINRLLQPLDLMTPFQVNRQIAIQIARQIDSYIDRCIDSKIDRQDWGGILDKELVLFINRLQQQVDQQIVQIYQIILVGAIFIDLKDKKVNIKIDRYDWGTKNMVLLKADYSSLQTL